MADNLKLKSLKNIPYSFFIVVKSFNLTFFLIKLKQLALALDVQLLSIF